MTDLQAYIRALVSRTLEERAAESLSQSRAVCPVRTGALRASLRMEVEGDRAAVSTDCPYAAVVQEKTGFLRIR